MTSYFLLSRNKNTENIFLKENIFLDLLKITFLVILRRVRFLVSTENEILLFPVFVCLRKYFH